MNRSIYLVGIWFALVTACDSTERPDRPYPYTELAMRPGMIVEATNKSGTVSIEYISPLERRYRWDDHDEVRQLIPRRQEWNGKRGAYDPAPHSIFVAWLAPRIVAEDSAIHFSSVDEMRAWLHQGSAVLDWVYTGDGLVVGFAKAKDRNQVNIEVYQLLLDGREPTALEGSQPDRISVRTTAAGNQN